MDQYLERIASALETIAAALDKAPEQTALTYTPNTEVKVVDIDYEAKPPVKKKRAKKKTARKTEEQPGKTEEPPMDYDVIRRLIVEIVQYGEAAKSQVRNLLASYDGAKKASEIPTENWDQLHHRLTSILTGLQTEQEDDEDFA